ncbi:MAG: ester cyclase [Planctomycetes bacterium]|nr:ester cyclase [Planctomycetota bacterium]
MEKSLVSKIKQANAALIVEGNLEAIGEFFTADYVAHVTDRDLEGGHAGIRKFLVGIRRAFKELQVEVEVLVVSKDHVAWQRTVRGKHVGAFRGFPATGRRIVWRDMLTSRFRKGLIAEEWAVSDLAERLLLARKR